MPRLIAAVALMFAPFAAGSLAAQDGDAALGSEIFERRCTTCHGATAAGDGPMANVLMIKPPDLTRLTLRHDGVFPLERVVKRIDGRDPLVSHGSPMPVYGGLFDEARAAAIKTDAGQPILTSSPVVDLVAYLREIQVEK